MPGKQGRIGFLTEAFRSKGGKPKNFSDTFEKQAAMPDVIERFYRQLAEDNFPDKPPEVKERWIQMKIKDQRNKLKKRSEEHQKITAWLQEQHAKEYKPPTPEQEQDKKDYEHYKKVYDENLEPGKLVPKNHHQYSGLTLHRVRPRTIGELHPRDRTAHSKGTE